MNAISVDSCQRIGLLFEDLVAVCELVNSSKIQVQVTRVVPTIAVDKCDGVQVGAHFLPVMHGISNALSRQIPMNLLSFHP